MNIKRQGVSGVFGCLAILLGIAAAFATVVCSTMNSAYGLNALGLIIALEVVGILLVIAGLVMNGKDGMASRLGILPILAAIIVLVQAAGRLISERILLISGLFSYNAQNTAGWQVFYATVAAIAALVVASLALIIASFLRSEPKDEM